MPIQGLDEVLSNLESMSGKVQEASIEGMQIGMELIVGRAKEKAPVDTGELRNKIIAYTEGENGEVRAYAEHAPYVEFGTGPVGAASGGKGSGYSTGGWVYPAGVGKDGKPQFRYTRGQPARPFLYPAFAESKGDVVKIIADKIREAIGGV